MERQIDVNAIITTVANYTNATKDNADSKVRDMALDEGIAVGSTTRYRGVERNSDSEQQIKKKYELNCHDVLLGRGPAVSSNIGNGNFRRIIWDFKDEYRNARNPLKADVALKVLKHLANLTPPGSVVEKLSDGTFGVVTGNRAIVKVCQSLRELKHRSPSHPEGFYRFRLSKRGGRHFNINSTTTPSPLGLLSLPMQPSSPFQFHSMPEFASQKFMELHDHSHANGSDSGYNVCLQGSIPFFSQEQCLPSFGNNKQSLAQVDNSPPNVGDDPYSKSMDMNLTQPRTHPVTFTGNSTPKLASVDQVFHNQRADDLALVSYQDVGSNSLSAPQDELDVLVKDLDFDDAFPSVINFFVDSFSNFAEHQEQCDKLTEDATICDGSGRDIEEQQGAFSSPAILFKPKQGLEIPPSPHTTIHQAGQSFVTNCLNLPPTSEPTFMPAPFAEPTTVDYFCCWSDSAKSGHSPPVTTDTLPQLLNLKNQELFPREKKDMDTISELCWPLDSLNF